jgi:phage-related protein
MNEELKIIIKAVADEAKREIEDVRKELDKMKKQGEEANKVSETFRKIGRGAAIAATSVVALTTAMAGLGRTANEAQKAHAKLVSGFQSAGSSAAQAKATYAGLYRFLGDTATATEAANLLAQLTTEEKALTEWTTILQGVYATFPDSIPVESLAEAANETAKTGQITGALADALNWVGISEDAFAASLANCNNEAEREALIRSTLMNLYGGAAALYEQNNAQTIAYNESQNRLNEALVAASKYLTPLLTALNNMAAVLLQAVGPALQVVSAILITFCQWIAAAAQAIASFFGGFKSNSTKEVDKVAKTTNTIKTNVSDMTAGAGGLGSALKDASKQAENLKKQTMGFDELNVVSSPSSAGGGAGGAGVGGLGAGIGDLEIPDMSNFDLGLEDFNLNLEEVKERLEGVLVLAGLVGAALAAWGITHVIKNFDVLKGKLAKISGIVLIVAGALLLVQGYSDAWANGIDWGNLALMLSGIGLIVGGLALAFGPMAAAIGLVVGSIALLIVGIKDLVDNGYSMEAVITIAIGAITLLIGVIWAMNAALLANPITWVVVAIMALVAAFVILWNECEGFRKFFINMWEVIKNAFNATVEWLKQACKSIGQFFVDAWGVVKNAWNSAGSWFKNIWTGIKNAFSAVSTWFGDIFTSAWNSIKKAFSSVSSFFSGIWNSIKSIFSQVGSAIAEAVSGAFKKAINWVLDKAISIINGFIGAINAAISVINAIPGVSIKKLSKLAVPQLARGGIVDSATLAVIGERGKEAVVPLENNTEWMDKLADRLAARSNTPSKIVLMLDGTELGWANINSINNITKQTGQLQLRIM